ncbi:MAG: hypothetical protein B1H13_00520 [Desulfobacteraceae bacterium 4484_190.3]|nr:MAG: hypothetical protein B1H13_00520 [Desulfobacteraceae bacterium 4484_190.3]
MRFSGREECIIISRSGPDTRGLKEKGLPILSKELLIKCKECSAVRPALSGSKWRMAVCWT